MGAVAVAPDGRWVVTGGEDGGCGCGTCDQPGASPPSWAATTVPVPAVAVAPDGRWVVTGGR